MTDVSSPKTLRHEMLDTEPNDLVVRIAEEREYLTVGVSDCPEAIDDDHRIWRGFECATGEFRWCGQHSGNRQMCRTASIIEDRVITPRQCIPTSLMQRVRAVAHIEEPYLNATRLDGPTQ